MTTRTQRRWSINGDFFALQPTGVARYASEVTRALDALVAQGHPLARGLDIDLIAPRPGPAGLLKRIPARVVPELRTPRLPQWWVQVQLPNSVESGLLSFCNLAPVSVRRQIVCIHDLHTWTMPNSYGLLFRWAHRLILPALGRRASVITTVSSLARDQLIRFGVAPAHKIVIAGDGGDHVQRWDAGRSRLILGQRPFVFALGRRQAYKNSELIWRIAEELSDRGIDIFVAGDIDARDMRRFCTKQPPNIRLLGRISDDDLAFALSKALCFVFPSRAEGFGVPAVEAMALGCPVIASSAPCLPEICGDAAIYADPDDVAAWIAAVDRLRLDNSLVSELMAKGRKQAALYSWRATAETYLHLMAHVDRVPLPHRHGERADR